MDKTTSVATNKDDLEWTPIALRDWGLYQRKGGLRFSIDAVLLAHFVDEAKEILDLCTGTGIIAFILAARFERAKITGLDIQPQLIENAIRSRDRNGIDEGRLDFAIHDLREKDTRYQRRFNLITVNPPFFKVGHGAANPDSETALARHEHTANLDDVFRFAAYALKERGRIAMIHRATRLDEIITAALKYKCKPVRIQPIYARGGESAKLVMIECCYLGRQDLVIEEPLYIYDDLGYYRPTIQSWYEGESHGND